MRHLHFIGISVFFVFFFGCKTQPRSYTDITTDGHLKHTTVYIRTSKTKCSRKEYIVVRDTSNQTIRSKEYLRYDCKGTWAQIVFCKKWKLENGKLVRQKENCKPDWL